MFAQPSVLEKFQTDLMSKRRSGVDSGIGDIDGVDVGSLETGSTVFVSSLMTGSTVVSSSVTGTGEVKILEPGGTGGWTVRV